MKLQLIFFPCSLVIELIGNSRSLSSRQFCKSGKQMVLLFSSVSFFFHKLILLVVNECQEEVRVTLVNYELNETS